VKLFKSILFSLLILGISSTSAMAYYGLGVKYYNRYVRNETHLNPQVLVNELHVSKPEQIRALLANDAEGLIKFLKSHGYEKSAEGFEKMAHSKNGDKKLKNVGDFFIGLMNGKVLPECS
jgi:hypothetical protein